MKTKLLLLHGALGASAQFTSIEKILKEQFEVLKFDFSGHGYNEFYYGNLSIELFTNDVLKFLVKIGEEPIAIFGYSMGGFVALNLALQHPLRVKKIGTLATKFNWSRESAEAEIKLLNPIKIREKVPAFAAHLQKLHGEKWEQLMLQTADMMIQLGENNLLTKAELARICCPVLFGIGDSDKMVSLDETEAAHKAVSNSKLHIFLNTPHPWEQANQPVIAEELAHFFQSPAL